MLNAETWHEKPISKAPIPSLIHTFNRYLEYASVIAENPQQFEKTKENVKYYLKNGGEEFQNKLIKIAETSPNWINHFWLSEMYLKPRYPLPLYSNPAYIFPKKEFKNIEDYLSYTSYMIRGLIEFKNLIDKRKIEKDFVDHQCSIPMCMDQYDRLLTSYREANREEDILIRSSPKENEHIIVMCQNQAFIVATKLNNELLSANKIRYQLQKIIEIAKNRNNKTVVPIAGATSGEREIAAKFWKIAKIDPTNAKSFNEITTAVFNVCLDIDFCDKITSQSEEGQFILHGYGSENSGLNRWYEHTIQLVVGIDGTNGLCIEHSVAEGIVIIKMAEYAINFVNNNIKKREISQSPIKIKPKPLKWKITSEMIELLEKQISTFDKIADDIELKCKYFNDFGKEKIKSLKISPDGFVQLSMQLAHYRMHKKLVSTYESASIRRFIYGRVDNIRSATPEALHWVQKMDDNNCANDEKIHLFRKAVEKQALITKENITGYGIDNHLCALSTMAQTAVEKNEIKKQFDVFTDSLWLNTMRFPLTTSQVTTSVDIPKQYLCYGPVVDDGYGNGYNIQPDKIIMAVSARKSCPFTDANKFADAICHAMKDIVTLLTK